MAKDNYIYVASCVFTKMEPYLSFKVQDYIKEKFGMKIIRCCVPNYKLKEFEEAMPKDIQPRWKDLPDYVNFTENDTMVYVCHNCAAIFQEKLPKVNRLSLWEFILKDSDFKFPDFSHKKITLQDCWRSYDNRSEQEAVRALLKKMNIEVVEQEENYEKTQFCGVSLYAESPKRNLLLAPERFVKGAEGKFIPHTSEEQTKIMQEYCKHITTDEVVTYCHYCTAGLKLGGKKAIHLASLLFDESNIIN